MHHVMMGCALGGFLLAAGAAEAAEAVRPVEDFDAAWQVGRWAFSNGPEFPGAKGSFDRAKEAARTGDFGGRLAFDFSGGGTYVGAVLKLDKAPQVAAVRLAIKRPGKNRLTFRYSDATGQTLQRPFDVMGGEWAEVTIPMSGWTGHWGGANDGVPHGPPVLIAFLVENTDLTRGEVWLDDIRLVEGQPGKGAGMITSECVAARFGPGEGWSLRADGDAGGSKLDGRRLRFDFSKGATMVGIGPTDRSLLGLPREIRIRMRGSAAGHPVRLLLATHFMTFEKTIGEFAKDGENEIVVQAPPGEGWKWFGGENDGKVHGPLRISGLLLDAAGRKDSGELELVDIRVKTSCDPQRAMVLVAGMSPGEKGGEFVATIRSIAASPIEADVLWTVRDWAGAAVDQGRRKVTVPAAGEPVEVRVAKPAWPRPPASTPATFLEAEFSVEAPGQMVPPAQAYYVAPLEPRQGAAPEPESPFGMGLYLYRYNYGEPGLREMERAAALAQDAGVKWSREEFHWGAIERQKARFDWSFYDKMVACAKQHGISLYGILGYWSGWTKPYTDEGIEDYCRFAAAAAERYRADIRHWEVWNEPNIFFWQGPKDQYAELLKRAYAAIKKANPDALVLGCSTAGIDEGFIRRTMDLGGPFDILTIHPYRAALKDQAFIAELKHVAEVAKRPDGTIRPSWITEMGWATYTVHNGAGQDFSVTSQRDQARLLARAYIDAIASGVAPNISWYDFRNDGDDPFNFEHNMGVVARDFQPKPACRAYATMTRLLGRRKPLGPMALGDGIVAFRFAEAAEKNVVVALWGIDADREAEVPCPAATATLTDLMGNAETLSAAGGKVKVRASRETPVFLTVAP